MWPPSSPSRASSTSAASRSAHTTSSPESAAAAITDSRESTIRLAPRNLPCAPGPAWFALAGSRVDALLDGCAQPVRIVVQRALEELDLVPGVHALDLVAQDLHRFKVAGPRWSCRVGARGAWRASAPSRRLR